MSESEQLLSFPSGHSTAIAATSFFLAADLSDHLVSGPLKAKGPVTRALVGRVLPYVSAAGLSWLVMYSRIKDQRHWLSDTLKQMQARGVATSVGTSGERGTNFR